MTETTQRSAPTRRRARRRRPDGGRADARPPTPRRAARADPQGLRVRPGGPLVPGLRRLLDPGPDPEGDARLRLPEGEHRLHLGHRLLGPAAVLHEHLRVPHDPRPRAGDRDRAQGRPAGPDGLGDHRRRRRAVDRGQPPDPRAAPERRRPNHHVQQPDLRAHQGPGEPDVGVRQGHQVVAVRDDRLPGQPAGDRARGGGELHRALGGHAHRAPAADARGRGHAPAARRSSRSSRTATSSTTARSGTSPIARFARTGCSCSSTASR